MHVEHKDFSGDVLGKNLVPQLDASGTITINTQHMGQAIIVTKVILVGQNQCASPITLLQSDRMY